MEKDGHTEDLGQVKEFLTEVANIVTRFANGGTGESLGLFGNKTL